MNRPAWTKKKASITIALCIVIAVSSVIFLQNNLTTTQAAIINPHPGLVGWWRFDEGSGNLAGDSSGNGNNGTLKGGASWVAGKYGTAISFNGANGYVDVPSPNLSSSAGLTLSAWIYISSIPSYGAIIEGNWWGTGNRMWVYVSSAENSLRFSITDSNGVMSSAGVSPTSYVGAWLFMVCTAQQGAPAKLYLDGVLLSTGAISNTGTFGTPAPIGIGALDYNGPANFFNGIIDEVHIYSRALSATEIQAAFQQSPDFSPYILASVPQGTTQVITTLSWQGTGNINVTVTTPSQTYTESMMPEYQKTTYSTTNGGPLTMLNIKRLSISVNALTLAQTWNITLTYDNTVSNYQISVETQK